jgi:hypothetical protein
MMKRLIILLFCSLLPVCAALGNELEIIDLRHRSADELLPVIRPLLNKDEVASGMNYQLILRASPRSIAQIRHLLEEIDTVPRRLNITVMQNVDSETAARLTEVNAHLGAGQGRAGVRIISTRSLDDDQKTQQIQVLEGNRALIRSGQSVPVTQRVQNAWGTQVTTQFRNVDSGFYVLPRIHGDTVTLQISAQNDALAAHQNDAAIRTQQTDSMVTGRLGEWIEVGGIGQQGNTDNSTISSRSTSSVNEQRTVLIKVEELN